MADIELTREGPVLTIWLSRPENKNAVTDPMTRAIGDALIAADRDASIAAVIIEGRGPDFCAGNDLSLIRDMASGKLAIDDLSVDHFLGALSQFEKPLLAGVRGRAIGIGATLLLHCDVVYGASDSSIRFPFVDLSLVPEAAATYLLPLRVGYARAYALLCMCEAITGLEAAACGLITASVDRGSVSASIAEAARKVASKPATALRATKRLMKDTAAITAALARDKAIFIRQLQSYTAPI